MSIEVVAPGMQTSVQDLGRPGYRRLGVAASGAADPAALRVANLLVGNPEGAPALEITLAGGRLRFTTDACLALTGAPIAAAIAGAAVPLRRPVRVPAGSLLSLGRCAGGARSYLAVAGGLAVARVLGSASADLLGRIGGRALDAGDVLAIGSAGLDAGWRVERDGRPFASVPFSATAEVAGARAERGILRVVAGSHLGHLDAAAQAALFAGPWWVAAESSRSGVRLHGPTLAADLPELVSEPALPGTVQLPAGGQPIILGVEGPTVGGYARVAHVIRADLGRLGQLRGGDAVRFTPVSPEAAHQALAAEEQRLGRLALALRLRLTTTRNEQE